MPGEDVRELLGVAYIDRQRDGAAFRMKRLQRGRVPADGEHLGLPRSVRWRWRAVPLDAPVTSAVPRCPSI